MDYDHLIPNLLIEDSKMRNRIKLIISIVIPVSILMIPTHWIPIQNLTVIEHRYIAIFFIAALFWILEPIPIFATSVLVIFLELIATSNKSLIFFRKGMEGAHFGTLLSYKDIMATFASPIVILFIGGFFLAMAATKYRLDINLARVLLKPFGKKPQNVMLGLMFITAIFSMFMSNTATTAMMLAILAPVLTVFEEGDRGKIGFILAIPFAANIGGMGTPIGTPPNAVALKYLTGGNAIAFGTWMLIAFPLVVILMLFLWRFLLLLFPPATKEIKLNIRGKFLKNWKAITVYITFGVTIILWLFGSLHGMNSYTVAMVPIAVFTVLQIITAEDLKRMSWDVLWLIAGGIALGQGLEKSGLALHVVESIPFSSFSPYIVIVVFTLITVVMSTFMSNTATANLILPLASALGVSLSSIIPLGGSMMIILAVAFSASLAMALPISTPPNALAHATGQIESKQMLRAGIVVSLVGLLGVYLLMYILNLIGFL